ncbi:MAG: response regulator [Campylobacterota bacterium]|nr:response regulator [Campylobacterota bacterium]
MVNILVIENAEENRCALQEALEHFDNLKIVSVNSYEEAVELSKEHYFELVFFDVSCIDKVCFETIRTLKALNVEMIIIAFNSEHDPETEQTILSLGAKDYINKFIDVDLMAQRLENYLEIIQLKKQQLFNTEAVNLFNKNIFQRMTTFNLDSHTGIVEFWDYFMEDHIETYEYLKESIGILYAFSSWLFKSHHECQVIQELDHSALYLTMTPIDTLSDKVIDDIFRKYDGNVAYLKQDNKLSLKLNKIGVEAAMETADEAEIETVVETVSPDISEKPSEELLEIDDETQKILGKTHFNKISAAEFVEMTAISYMSKIDSLIEIEDQIDEALISFEDEPSTEKTHLISEAFMRYVEVIKLLVEFDHLVFAIMTLASAIDGITEEKLTPKEIKKFTTLALHLINDLSSWRDNIFIKQEANDIHYLDSSLLSSCLQIESIFADKKIEEEEDDFELF